MSQKGEIETPQGGEGIGMSDKGKTPQGSETEGIERPSKLPKPKLKDITIKYFFGIGKVSGPSTSTVAEAIHSSSPPP